MASRAVDRSLADFIAGALNPPLIMALVGSLVFFLQEILYQGLYRGTLQWVLFFFVFGAVLIARMSMQIGMSEKSWAYGLVLGGLVWLSLRIYIDYSENPTLAGRSGFINLGLIALIWWSAHRLTLDCTFLSEDSAGQGAGLLDAAGLDKLGEKETPGEQPKKPKKSKKKTPEEKPGLDGWWARFQRYLERRKKQPKTLGVWVVFFSLAALPLFGLGQAQIPAYELDRRSYAFTLLLIYVAAGLGLLLTTSFLSLRMYLRERSVTMPAGITLGWLFLGALLILGHLLVSGLLPRPADPQPLWDWTGLTNAQERDPARWSPMRERDDGRNPPRKKTGKSGSAVKSKDGEQDSGSDAKSKKSGPGKDKSGEKSDDAKAGDDGDNAVRKNGEQGDKPAGGDEPKQGADPANGMKLPELLAPVSPLLDMALKFAKGVIVFLVVLVVIIIVGRAALRFLANFTFWAQKMLAFFDNLWKKDQVEKSGQKAEEEKQPTLRPFDSYNNPFETGRAKQISPAELVSYSFAALQAWGREHDLPRAEGETAMEFAIRVGLRYPDLGEESRKLALLYARLAYSTDTLSEVKIDSLRVFWTSLCNVLDEAHAVE